MILSALVDGKTDLADILFLLAAVLFAIVAFIRWPERSIAGTLEPLGLVLLSVAWFVL